MVVDHWKNETKDIIFRRGELGIVALHLYHDPPRAELYFATGEMEFVEQDYITFLLLDKRSQVREIGEYLHSLCAGETLDSA